MSRVVFTLALAFVTLAGCLSDPSTPGPAGPPGSGIYGVVMIGPTCPVARDPPDPDCADRPCAADFAVTTVDGSSEVASFTSDAGGRFNVSLPAGDYAVRLADPASSGPTRCANTEPIAVRDDTWSEAKVTCDSGIR